MARPKGSPNKATANRERVIASQGLTPLAFMLDTLRNEDNDLATRMDAAKAAAPFVHPKLSTIEAKVKSEVALVTSIKLVGPGD